MEDNFVSVDEFINALNEGVRELNYYQLLGKLTKMLTEILKKSDCNREWFTKEFGRMYSNMNKSHSFYTFIDYFRSAVAYIPVDDSEFNTTFIEMLRAEKFEDTQDNKMNFFNDGYLNL